MAGKKGVSGRPPEPGDVYQFTFYYRFIPGEDPPELKQLLDSIIKARGRKRRDIIRTALLGGADQAQEMAIRQEDSEEEALLSDMLNLF
jgi:hypothetical protein